MSRKPGRDVIQRCPGNPLISLHDLPFAASDIWNAGVTRFAGEYLLLITVETLEGTYRIHQARNNAMSADDQEHVKAAQGIDGHEPLVGSHRRLGG